MKNLVICFVITIFSVSLAAETCISLSEAKNIARKYEFPKYDNGFFRYMNEVYVKEGKEMSAGQFPQNFYQASSRQNFQEQLNAELKEEFLNDTEERFFYFISHQAMMGCRIAAQLYILCDGSAKHTSKMYDCL